MGKTLFLFLFLSLTVNASVLPASAKAHMKMLLTEMKREYGKDEQQVNNNALAGEEVESHEEIGKRMESKYNDKQKTNEDYLKYLLNDITHGITTLHGQVLKLTAANRTLGMKLEATDKKVKELTSMNMMLYEKLESLKTENKELKRRLEILPDEISANMTKKIQAYSDGLLTRMEQYQNFSTNIIIEVNGKTSKELRHIYTQVAHQKRLITDNNKHIVTLEREVNLSQERVTEVETKCFNDAKFTFSYLNQTIVKNVQQDETIKTTEEEIIKLKRNMRKSHRKLNTLLKHAKEQIFQLLKKDNRQPRKYKTPNPESKRSKESQTKTTEILPTERPQAMTSQEDSSKQSSATTEKPLGVTTQEPKHRTTKQSTTTTENLYEKNSKKRQSKTTQKTSIEGQIPLSYFGLW